MKKTKEAIKAFRKLMAMTGRWKRKETSRKAKVWVLRQKVCCGDVSSKCKPVLYNDGLKYRRESNAVREGLRCSKHSVYICCWFY